MARYNSRPDIIYVKPLNENDKDVFERLLTHFRMTNNSNAMLKLLHDYFPLLEKLQDLQTEVKRLESLNAQKDRKLNSMAEQKESMLKQITVIEKSLNESKLFISEL